MRFTFLQWLRSVSTRTLTNGRRAQRKYAAGRPKVRLAVEGLEDRVVPSATDTDRDRLSDFVERRGWVVTVTRLDGSKVIRKVTSNLGRKDTDGDGLSDWTERRLKTDARNRDTDGDGLNDFLEVNKVKSNATSQDTDGDGANDGDDYGVGGAAAVITGSVKLQAFGFTASATTACTVQVTDDGDAGFSTFGSWSTSPNPEGFQGDVSFSDAGNGADKATWTFPVTPGHYRVSATWSTHANRATNAPFTVLDGTTALDTVRVNQEQAPNDFTEQGVGWENMGTYKITGNSLVVELTDNANEYVIADAVRVECVEDPTPPDTTLPRVTGAASLGNTTVLVAFSEPMGDDAINPAHYFIVQPNVSSEVGFVPILSAAFNPTDRRSVLLTTASQNEVTYSVTAVNVHDLAGNPLAPVVIVGGLRSDPSTAAFPGTPASEGQIVDTDGDGLSNNAETRGWVVTVTNLDGTTITRQVTSDPLVADTDEDLLSDAQELNIGTDPRRLDTDGDQLDDNSEFNEIYSDATKQDTDRDGLDDSLEFGFFKTSPFFADSDGDQINDGDEILGNRNARVSDLPRPEIEVGAINLQLDVRFTESNAKESRDLETTSFKSTLTQSEKRSLTRQYTGNVEAKLSHSSTTQTESGGADGFKLIQKDVTSGEVSAGFTFQQTEESSSETTRSYENSLGTEKEVTSGFTLERHVVGAVMQATVNLRNVSNLAYRVKNLQVTAFIQDPLDRTRLTPVATLLPDNEPAEGFTLGPLVTNRGPLIFSNTTIVPTLVESLMANSSGLIFRISNYDIINEEGRNFAFISQDVVERTAQVVIDFGGARSLRARVSGEPIDENQPGDETEIHRVATSAGRAIDDTDGDGTINVDPHQQVITVNPPVGSTFAYEDGGEAVDGQGGEFRNFAFQLGGNRWRALELPNPITITEDSVLEFDMFGGGPNNPTEEISAIGMDNDLIAGPDRIFQLGGTQSDYGIQDFHTPYHADHYSIPIGKYPQFLGENKYLTFAVDDDDSPTVSLAWFNIKITTEFGGDKRVIFGPTGKEVGITLFEAMDAIGLTRFEARLDPATGRFLEYEPGSDEVFDFANKDDLFLNSYSTFVDSAGREKIFRIRGIANDLVIQKNWEILTPDGIDQVTNLNNLILKTNAPVSLNYVQDLDKDLLPADVEFFLRSTDSPLPFGALVLASTDFATTESVRFNTDPGLITGTLVRVTDTATGGGLTAGTNYFVGNLGGGSYRFYDTAAKASAGTDPIDLTGNITAGIFSPTSPTATNTTTDSVTFDPGFPTATNVRVIADGGGLKVNTDYFLRNLGGGSYSFYDSAAHANAGGDVGRIKLTGNVAAAVFSVINPSRAFNPTFTDFTNQSVTFDPGFATGTVVTVTATGGGLTAGTGYIVRNVGGGSYSFYDTVANAIAGTATGRADLTGTISAGIFSPTAKGRDTDRDGLDDRFEALIGWTVSTPLRTYTVSSSPVRRDSNFDNPKLGADSDKDGKLDRTEYDGSDLNVAPAGWNDRLTLDTNGDDVPDAPNGLRDRFEVYQIDANDLVLDPIRNDTDGDGINDATEIIGFQITRIEDESLQLIDHTDPTTPFTDSDTFPDGFEKRVGLDPTDGRDTDEDGDGLPDQVETTGWKVGTVFLDPEVQTVDVRLWQGSLSFTLQYGSGPSTAQNTTASLPHNASASDVELALNGLAAIRELDGVVTVTVKETVILGLPFNTIIHTFTITFGGALAGHDQTPLIRTGQAVAGATLQDGATTHGVEGVSVVPYQRGQLSPRLGQSKTDSVDSDEDGLTDYEEFFLRTDPKSKDTDGDRIEDRVESLGYALGHKVGTKDIGIIKTDPLDADTDNDMRSDGAEAELVDIELNRWVVRARGVVKTGEVSSSSAYQAFSNPLVADGDFDGLVDGEEYGDFNGDGNLDPSDFDNDGRIDAGVYRTDPNNANTDGDKRDDGVEVRGGLNPLVEDFRVTVLADWIETFSDGDGATDQDHQGGSYELLLQVLLPDESGVAGLSATGTNVLKNPAAPNYFRIDDFGPPGRDNSLSFDRYSFADDLGLRTTDRSLTFSLADQQRFAIALTLREHGPNGSFMEFKLGGLEGTRAYKKDNGENKPAATEAVRPVYTASQLKNQSTEEFIQELFFYWNSNDSSEPFRRTSGYPDGTVAGKMKIYYIIE